MPAATSNTLKIPARRSAQNGNVYHAVYTNTFTIPTSMETTANATLTVNPALSIAPAALADATKGIATNQTITVSDGTTPYTTFEIPNFVAGGTGLTEAANLTLNAAAGTVVLSGTPTAAGTATFTVHVVDPPGGDLSKAYTLTVLQPVPTVTAVTPTNGPTAGGTSVTITGTDFENVSAVKFGATNATTFSFVNATTVTATSPAGAAGTVDITVTTPGGTSTTSAADQFTYVAAPTVASVGPSSGSTTGGTSVTITGTNFTGATAVTFGGTAATNVIVVGPTSITATTPAHAAGAVDVVVTTPGGPGTGSGVYTYVAPPTVASVSPNAGPIAGGTDVTITGTDFTGATAVTFGGTAATNVIVVGPTSITATTPAHAAGAVDVVVTTPAGTGTGTNVYTYAAAPTVASVSPNAGPIGRRHQRHHHRHQLHRRDRSDLRRHRGDQRDRGRPDLDHGDNAGACGRSRGRRRDDAWRHRHWNKRLHLRGSPDC